MTDERGCQLAVDSAAEEEKEEEELGEKVEARGLDDFEDGADKVVGESRPREAEELLE